VQQSVFLPSGSFPDILYENAYVKVLYSTKYNRLYIEQRPSPKSAEKPEKYVLVKGMQRT
jgi:hypothetical protein